MKLLLLFCFLLCYNNALCNEKIEVELIGINNVTEIEVSPPIGGYANYFYKKYYPVSNNKFSFNLNVSNAVFLQLRAGYRRVYLFVSPGDDIKIKIFNTTDKFKTLQFNGDNAAGQYWYNMYNYVPLENMIGHGVLFDALYAKNKNETLKKLGHFFGKQTQPLEPIFKQNKIDLKFLSLVKTDIRAKHALNMINRITNLREKATDKRIITNYQVLIDALKAFGGPNKVENTRCNFGVSFLMYYYSMPKEEVADKNNISVWGVYKNYTMAPDPIKMFLMGDALLMSKVFGSDEFNYNNAFNAYSKEFPKSPYVTFLNGLKPVLQDPVDNRNIILDTAVNFSTFEQLKQHFKGKAIYIDLWATWCVPCRAEFPSYKRIEGALKRKNITSVFISIDAPSENKMWRNVIYQSQLPGHHIRVNKALMGDIRKVIYKNGVVSIPRYIIINKHGDVVNWDAPRPSEPKLIAAISKL
jgi:thiol-disulfide isomerase/thioredoxin